MLNRHGLIAGRHRHRQDQDAPAARRPAVEGRRARCFVADIKGDLTGLAAPGDATNPKVQERAAVARLDVRARRPPGRVPVAVGQARRPGAGDRPLVRAAAARQGPRPQRDADVDPVAGLQVLRRQRPAAARPRRTCATTLKFLVVGRGQADPRGLRRDVAARRSACCCARSSSSSRRAPTSSSASPSSTSTDLLRTTPDGAGDRQRPRAVRRHGQAAPVLARSCSGCSPSCTRSLPEAGDLPKPKLFFFFDEAHLLFDDASEALMDQVERTARLIRSKGVGVYFVTQAPTDVPSSVLAQLGNRVQHALRAFTPDDADALRKTARTFPMTDFYDVEKTITSLGHRRGARHGALAARRPDAARRDPPAAARLADGADPRGRDGAADRAGSLYGDVRRADRPRERPRDPHGAPGRARRPPWRAPAGAPGTLGCRPRPRNGAPSSARPASWSGSAATPSARRRRPSASGTARRRQIAREAERAAKRQQDMIQDVGGDLLRGVFGTLFGGRGAAAAEAAGRLRR